MKNLAILLSAAAILYLLPSLAVAEDPGAALFQSHCQMCHGADGKATTPTGKAFKAVDFHDPAVMKLSDTELATIITKGKNNMPAFGTRLTPPQIQSLVSYIRVLQKQ